MTEERIAKGIKWLGDSFTEESQKEQGQLNLIRQEMETQNRLLRALNENLEKVLAHVSSIDGTEIQNEAHLGKIEGSSFITQTEVMRLRRGNHNE